MRTALPTLEAQEAADVIGTLVLVASVRHLGAMRLLLARLDWDRFFKSASPPWAKAPEAARATMTRQAKRDQAARQRARRTIMSASRTRSLTSLLS